jgi:2-polyprenyl-3-methyl-5-hydroxy-6-metoxy-1,4-benzoquinol methylase
MINPHFDHNRVVWSDDYSGLYQPVDYSQQFDHEWRFFLEKKLGFHNHTGVETADFYIDERIQELTGARGRLEQRKYGKFIYRLLKFARRRLGYDAARMAVGGRLYLEPKFPVDYFQGKTCLDIGCGAGRWTKTLISLGAQVKSVDMSEHGLLSTRRFNNDVERLDLFDILEKRPDLHGAFDFTICWGVIMCTHDPKLAFQNVAATVKPGGELYTMIYAPTYHNSPTIVDQRKYYHTQLATLEEKLHYAYSISDRPENAINLLDMLNTFYNWVVPEDVIYQWYSQQDYFDVVTLNTKEEYKSAYHVLGRKCQHSVDKTVT